jgi:integrase
MRRGEMLALRFGDIDWTRHRIMLRGETTKSGKGAVPLATARLRAVLEWLGAGRRLQDRLDTAVLKAHTVNPEWRMYG